MNKIAQPTQSRSTLSHLAMSACTFLILLFVPSALGAVASYFTEGSEGWIVRGDNAGPIEYSDTIGEIGGGVQARDETTGGVWYWVAPKKFLGDQKASFGQTLSFSVRQQFTGTTNQFQSDDVVIEGAGLRLAYRLPYLPTNRVWSRFEVPIRPGGWRLRTADGVLASKDDLLKVLGSVTNLMIRGEFQSGPDSGNLDNVELGSQSATIPPSLAIKVLPVLSITGDLGSTYRIEASESLTPDSWKPLMAVELTESPYIFVDFSAEAHPNRAYRVVLESALGAR